MCWGSVADNLHCGDIFVVAWYYFFFFLPQAELYTHESKNLEMYLSCGNKWMWLMGNFNKKKILNCINHKYVSIHTAQIRDIFGHHTSQIMNILVHHIAPITNILVYMLHQSQMFLSNLL